MAELDEQAQVAGADMAALAQAEKSQARARSVSASEEGMTALTSAACDVAVPAAAEVAARNRELCGEVGIGGLNEMMGVEFLAADGERVEARMPVTSRITQPFGLVHGGATIALLESVASLGSQLRCDLEVEQPFGVDVHVRHRKSGRAGYVRGVASYDHEEPSRGRAGGIKQYWTVVAYDDAGDVMSEGTIIVKVVNRARLAQVRGA